MRWNRLWPSNFALSALNSKGWDKQNTGLERITGLPKFGFGSYIGCQNNGLWRCFEGEVLAEHIALPLLHGACFALRSFMVLGLAGLGCRV